MVFDLVEALHIDKMHHSNQIGKRFTDLAPLILGSTLSIKVITWRHAPKLPVGKVQRTAKYRLSDDNFVKES